MVLNYCFSQDKGRVYKVDGKLVLINRDVIEKFRVWNSEMFRNDANYDTKFIQALLVLSIGSDSIVRGEIPAKVLRFLHGNISAI